LTAISSIGALAPNDFINLEPTAKAESGFEAMFSNQLSQVNASLTTAEGQLQSFAVGESTNVHEVMISLEQARLSFQLLVQVRNKLLEGYQDIMKMQI
jgi:flagellar hook-basal body complex protein FliE